MAEITFKGTPVSTNGALPKVGDTAPAFTLVDKSLVEKSLSDFAGVQKILTINPSYDTGVCQATARHFNKAVAGREGVAVLTISADLPFAQKRFCIVLDANDVVKHVELVSEVVNEPNYDAAIAALG